ncbi:hypothetical protein [Stutzerimonas tarimensis]|uniref:Uncharacterized protein n=1 Tax=Stutzerimonas tarimensis TaxID=1507735 RepID=A0ABV7T8D9_9GAMM
MTQQLDSLPLPCLLSVPEGTPPATGWPLLMFLHGYDEAAPMPLQDALTRHGPFGPGTPAWVCEHYLLVAPQLPRAGDHWFRFAAAVEAIAQHCLETEGADPRRCYLSGFSFGGNGVFDLARVQSRRWAALWAVDPTRVPEDPVRQPVWLSIGQIARRQEMTFIEALGLDAASEEPVGDRFYLDEGADHVRCAQLAFRDERIYGWLDQHELKDHVRRR